MIDGRECGACFECCRFMPIHSDILEKPSNLLCPNCNPGNGCTRYEMRPHNCSVWVCGWKQIETIPDDWRPDRSGLVFRTEALDEMSVTVAILDPNKAFLTEQFASLIGSWITNDVSVSFQAVGPVGHYPSRLHINEHLAGPLAARDLNATLSMFYAMYLAVSRDHVWVPDGISMRNDVPQL